MTAIRDTRVRDAIAYLPITRELPPITLYVFPHYAAARAAGFDLTGRHRNHAWMTERAWWPDRGGDVFRGADLARVVVTDSFQRWLYDQPASKHAEIGYALHYLRERLRVPPMVWIDL